MISKKLTDSIKLSKKRAYVIAQEAGVHPSTLSKIICGIEKVKNNDPRVIAIGRVVGLSAEDCFGNNEKTGDHTTLDKKWINKF